MVIEIELSKTGKKYKGMYRALVDDVDADLDELQWRVTFSSKRAYAVRLEGHPIRKKITMHQIIFERFNPKLERGQEVDHINLIGTDNRRENLRLATRNQQVWNQGKKSSNTSGYKGVSWHREMKKFQARIMFKKQSLILGYFDTPEEAHKAYCEKAKELFGEFARFE